MRQVNAEFHKTTSRLTRRHLFIKTWSHLAALLEDSDNSKFDNLLDLHLDFSNQNSFPLSIIGSLLRELLARAKPSTFTLRIAYQSDILSHFEADLLLELEDRLLYCFHYLVDLQGVIYSSLDYGDILEDGEEGRAVIMLIDVAGAVIYVDDQLRGWVPAAEYAQLERIRYLTIRRKEPPDHLYSDASIELILNTISPTIEHLTIPLLEPHFELTWLTACKNLRHLTVGVWVDDGLWWCSWYSLPKTLESLHLIWTGLSILELVQINYGKSAKEAPMWKSLDITLPADWYYETEEDVYWLEDALPTLGRTEWEEESHFGCNLDQIRFYLGCITQEEYEERHGLLISSDLVDLKMLVFKKLTHTMNLSGVRVSIREVDDPKELVDNSEVCTVSLEQHQLMLLSTGPHQKIQFMSWS